VLQTWHNTAINESATAHPVAVFCVSQPISGDSVWKPLRVHLILLSISILIIVVGIYLEPDARGYGTHQSIGLPACPVPQLTRFPCPTCGFTTSLAQMARGHCGAAFRSHVLGALVFLGACSFLFWTFTAPLFRASPLAAHRLLESKWFWCAVIVLFYLSWFVNIGAVVLGLKLYN
jgi:hypothetical protein